MATRDPFILDRPSGPGLRARDALVCIVLAALLLVLLEGPSIRRTGERMDAGVQRTAVLVVGRPAGWLADRVPVAKVAHRLTAWLSPDDALKGPGGFDTTVTARASAGVAPVTPDSFDPAALGQRPARPLVLHKLLVTGDSMAQPLDAVLARKLAGDKGVKTIRDAHLGTAISSTDVVDWGRLSVSQATKQRPGAVVMLLGANEGFPMPGAGGRPVQCCGPAWAAAYASRVRRMMNTYRRGGAARVYWLTLPLPRDGARAKISRAVNAAIEVAAQPYRAQVRVLDMAAVFTPGGRYRAAMAVAGHATVVREPDGIHLNEAGAEQAAAVVMRALRADFGSL